MTMITETDLTAEQKKTLRDVAKLIVTGGEGREQGQGRYFKRSDHQEKNTCCAIGACLIAAGAPEINSVV